MEPKTRHSAPRRALLGSAEAEATALASRPPFSPASDSAADAAFPAAAAAHGVLSDVQNPDRLLLAPGSPHTPVLSLEDGPQRPSPRTGSDARLGKRSFAGRPLADLCPARSSRESSIDQSLWNGPCSARLAVVLEGPVSVPSRTIQPWQTFSSRPCSCASSTTREKLCPEAPKGDWRTLR